jgi:hypothetical protein
MVSLLRYHRSQIPEIRQVVNWDYDSGDSAGASVEQSLSVYDTIVSTHPANALILNHEIIATGSTA